jgi:pimeloyl-ACP methyl ester carboxylesterase
MPVLHTNGPALFYLKVGELLPCLVMHGGLGFDYTGMHPWLDPLGDAMRPVYYDHRDNARSERLLWRRSPIECLCADALHKQLGPREVAVLGHSYGGFTALECALRYPERLSRLILSGTTLALGYEDESRPTPGASGDSRAARGAKLLGFDQSGQRQHFQEPETYLGAVRRWLGQ